MFYAFEFLGFFHRIRIQLNVVYRRQFVASFEFIDSTMTKEKNLIEIFHERKNSSINQPLFIIIEVVELTNFFVLFSIFLRKN